MSAKDYYDKRPDIPVMGNVTPLKERIKKLEQLLKVQEENYIELLGENERLHFILVDHGG